MCISRAQYAYDNMEPPTISEARYQRQVAGVKSELVAAIKSNQSIDTGLQLQYNALDLIEENVSFSPALKALIQQVAAGESADKVGAEFIKLIELVIENQAAIIWSDR